MQLRGGDGLGATVLAGAVRLGYRKELAILPIGTEREALFERLLARGLVSASVAPMAPGRFIAG